jgi:hypothetical protein
MWRRHQIGVNCLKLSVTGKPVSVTEKLSATARNVGNKRFSDAHFVRGSAICHRRLEFHLKPAV